MLGPVSGPTCPAASSRRGWPRGHAALRLLSQVLHATRARARLEHSRPRRCGFGSARAAPALSRRAHAAAAGGPAAVPAGCGLEREVQHAPAAAPPAGAHPCATHASAIAGPAPGHRQGLAVWTLGPTARFHACRLNGPTSRPPPHSRLRPPAEPPHPPPRPLLALPLPPAAAPAPHRRHAASRRPPAQARPHSTQAAAPRSSRSAASSAGGKAAAFGHSCGRRLFFCCCW